MPLPKPEMEVLSEAQRRAAILLAAGHKNTDVIKELGIDSTTLSRWKRDPNFMAVVDDLLNQLREEAVIKVRSLITKAIGSLEQILDDPNISARDRLTAIDKCLALVNFNGYQAQPELENIDAQTSEFLASRYAPN